jgi:hypothetical protein
MREIIGQNIFLKTVLSQIEPYIWGKREYLTFESFEMYFKNSKFFIGV